MRLRNAQRSSIETLWGRACASGDARKGLPARCDRTWFAATFCGGRHEVAVREGSDSVWDLVEGFAQYDTMAVLAAVPALRARFFTDPLRQAAEPPSPPAEGSSPTAPMLVEPPAPGEDATTTAALASAARRGVTLIGASEAAHGVRDPAGILQFLRNGYGKGLSRGHNHKARLVILASPRWDNCNDELLTCVMLRALHELGVIDCVGILITPALGEEAREANCDGDGGGGGGARSLADLPGRILKQLGMGFVPVRVGAVDGGDGATATEILKGFYDDAPNGVTLVATACVTDAAAFAEAHPVLFREKTQVGTAVGRCKGAQWRGVVMLDARCLMLDA